MGVWIGKLLFLCVMMEEKKKTSLFWDDPLPILLTERSLPGPFPKMHDLGLVLAQSRIEVGQKHMKQQTEPVREVINNCLKLMRTL